MASTMQTGAAGLTVHTPFVGGIGKEQRDIGALSYNTPAPSLFPTDTSGEERGRGRKRGRMGGGEWRGRVGRKVAVRIRHFYFIDC